MYARLSTIQDLIKSFSIDYLRQTNLLLGEGTNLENGADLANLEMALNVLPQPGVVAPPVEEKKERKKRTHDPNAPKRPLTPYFLYMQTARPIIATDLGTDAPKGAVQEEGQRRWGTMSAADKAVSRLFSFSSRLSCNSRHLTASPGLGPSVPVQPAAVQRPGALVQGGQCQRQADDG